MVSVELRELFGEPSQMSALQQVIEAAPDYMYRVTGHPPGAAEAQSLFSALPEGKTYEDRTSAYRLHEDRIRNWQGVIRIRLGVVRTNDDVLSFWRKQGFVETGEIKPYRYGKLESKTLILEKGL